MRRLLIGITIVSAVATTAASATTQPSSRCNGGPLAASKTPAGVGAGAAASASSITASGCNNGTVVKPPAKGAATFHAAPSSKSAYVDVDGDSNNTGKPCTDGFFRVAVGTVGVTFYDAPNGSYDDINPGKAGAQRARPESAQAFLTHTATNCR